MRAMLNPAEETYTASLRPCAHTGSSSWAPSLQVGRPPPEISDKLFGVGGVKDQDVCTPHHHRQTSSLYAVSSGGVVVLTGVR